MKNNSSKKLLAIIIFINSGLAYSMELTTTKTEPDLGTISTLPKDIQKEISKYLESHKDVKKLREVSKDLEKSTQEKIRPNLGLGLIKAISEGDTEKAKAIINSGKADINVQNKNGETALLWATIKKNEDIVRLLIKSKANIDIQENSGMLTALMIASLKGYKNIAKLLVEAGANIDLQNIIGNTALIIAALNGHEEIVKLLINSNADLDIMNRNGKTALDLGKTKKISDIILEETLLKNLKKKKKNT